MTKHNEVEKTKQKTLSPTSPDHNWLHPSRSICHLFVDTSETKIHLDRSDSTARSVISENSANRLSDRIIHLNPTRLAAACLPWNISGDFFRPASKQADAQRARQQDEDKWVPRRKEKVFVGLHNSWGWESIRSTRGEVHTSIFWHFLFYTSTEIPHSFHLSPLTWTRRGTPVCRWHAFYNQPSMFRSSDPGQTYLSLTLISGLSKHREENLTEYTHKGRGLLRWTGSVFKRPWFRWDLFSFFILDLVCRV